MKIVWHVFLKDLRRAAVPVSLLALVFAVKFIVGWRLIAGDEPAPEGFERAEWIVNLFRILELAGSYFLTLRLIGEDSVVATPAFWRTRPISGGRLLAAKLLGLVVILGVLPVVIAVPWWIGCGLNGAQVLLAAVDVLAVQLAVVAPALLVAVLTDSLARALLWTLVVGAGAGTWGIIWLVISRMGNDGITGSKIMVGTFVALLTVATVVVLQFFTRRPGRSVGVAVGGLLFTALCSIAWMWDLFEPRSLTLAEQHSREESPRASDIKIREGKAFLTKYPAQSVERARRMPWGEMKIELFAAGVPEDLRLLRSGGEHKWTWPDGREAVARDQSGMNHSAYDLERTLGIAAAAPDVETERWWKERRLKYGSSRRPQSSIAPGEIDVSGWIQVREDQVTPLQEAPAAHTFLAWFALVKPKVVMELPMQRGVWRAAEGRGTRVTSVIKREGDLSLSLLDGRFRSGWSRWRVQWFPGPFSRFNNDAVYFSVDRVHGLVSGMREGVQGKVPSVEIGSVTLSLRHLGTSGDKVFRNGNWVDRWPDWKENATLAIFDFPEVTRFVRRARAERFELETLPDAPGSAK